MFLHLSVVQASWVVLFYVGCICSSVDTQLDEYMAEEFPARTEISDNFGDASCIDKHASN